MPESRWRPLNSDQQEIRILELEPAGEYDDPVIIFVKYVSLAQWPVYSSLSYACGIVEESCPVSIDGLSCLVRPNLDSAIRHLRHTEYSKRLWIDALCIDQNNLQEKSFQVQLMREIYSKAQHVYAWVGKSDSTTALVYDVFDRLSNGQNIFEMHSLGGPLSHISISLLHNYFARAWFQRSWTLQEAVLAKSITILCGRHSIDMLKLAELTPIIRAQIESHTVESWFQNGYVSKEISNGLDDTRLTLSFLNNAELIWMVHKSVTDAIANRASAMSLWHILLLCRRREALNARDKIFAFQSLAAPTDLLLLQPDYSQSLAEIYTTISLRQINVGNICSVIRSAGTAKRRSPGLKSWVVNWSAGHALTDAALLRSNHIRQFRSTQCKSSATDQSTVLYKDGFLVISRLEISTIRTVGDVSEGLVGKPKPRVCDEALFQWFNMAGINLDRTENQPYVLGGTIYDTFWRTIVMDTSKNGTVFGDFSQPQDVRLLLRVLAGIPNFTSSLINRHQACSDDDDDVESALDSIIQTVNTATRAQRLVLDSAGCIGLERYDMIPGDKVFLLAGCSYPVVIRQSSTSSKTASTHLKIYEVVGDCYVHGMMDLQASYDPSTGKPSMNLVSEIQTSRYPQTSDIIRTWQDTSWQAIGLV